MKSGKYRMVERVFEEACRLDPDDRSAFVRAACDDDTSLRRRVEALLRRHDEPHALLDASAGDLGLSVTDEITDDLADAPMPESIGRYRILGVLGQGGMGVVYRAKQDDPQREVALKVLRPGLHSDRLIRRFRQESSVLAHLQHPGIAQVYDAGSEDSGLGAQPYFAMELIEGPPVLQYAAQSELSIRGRVELLIRICDAVQHAHQKGVIHRDLKPANILITERDGVAQPKVLDFGIARAMGPDFQTTTLSTGIGQLVGTLPYMSPEQAAGRPDEIDTRSDVFALGALGFEMLTGRLPLDVRDKPLPQAVRAIQEQEPARLDSTDRRYRGDLATIIGKAIDKDKARRYQSASEFAEDLRRYLADEPIIARRASALYQLRKFARRNKAVVISTCLVIALLAVSTIVSTMLYWRADARAEALRRAGYVQNIALAQNAYQANDVGRMREVLDLCPTDLRGWEWHRLQFLSDNSIRTLRGHTSPVRTIAFSPDGGRLATGTFYGPPWPVAQRDRTVRLWDFASGDQRMVLRDHQASVHAVKFTPDGRTLVSAGGTHRNARDIADFANRRWDADSGRLLAAFDAVGTQVTDLHVDAPRSIYASSDRGRIVRLDWETGAVMNEYPGNRYDVSAIDVSRNGSLIASAGWDGGIRVWRTDDAEPVFVYEDASANMLDVALRPDGGQVAGAAMDQFIRVWDIPSGELRFAVRGHDGPVTRIAYTSDGATLVSAGVDQAVRLWDAATGDARGVLRGARDRIYAIAISPDDRFIAAGGSDTTVRIWTARPPDDTVVLAGHTDMVRDVDWSRDGETLISAADDGDIVVWDAATGSVRSRFAGDGVFLDAVEYSPDERLLAVCDGAGRIIVRDATTGAIRARWSAGNRSLYDLVWHPSGDMIAACGGGVPTRIWDVRSTAELHVLDASERGDRCLAMSGDGSVLYAGGHDGQLRAWSTATGALLWSRPIAEDVVTGMDLRGDDALLALCDSSGVVTIVDPRGSAVLHQFPATNAECYSVEFSPDGSRLVVAGSDHRARLLDAATGEHLLTLIGHEQLTSDATFDPAGRTIASCSADGTIRLWPTHRER